MCTHTKLRGFKKYYIQNLSTAFARASIDPDVWEAARAELAEIIETGGTVELEPEPEPEPEPVWIPGFPFESILIGLALVGLI